jgi:hypothetical protein
MFICNTVYCSQHRGFLRLNRTKRGTGFYSDFPIGGGGNKLRGSA